MSLTKTPPWVMRLERSVTCEGGRRLCWNPARWRYETVNDEMRYLCGFHVDHVMLGTTPERTRYEQWKEGQ